MDELDLASLESLPGGWSGRTFLARVGNQRSVVRIVPPGVDPRRGDQPHEVDAALMHLLRGLVPVPEVLEVRRGDPGSGTPGLLITSWLPGERGDLVLPRLDVEDLGRLGAEVGVLLARLGGVPQPAAGPFVDATLRVGRWDGPDDLPGWVEHHEADLDHWTPDQRAGLLETARHAQEVLGRVDRVCLVHSDLNPKNWLVDPGTLEITGLVDWEVARSGHPFCDLGNTLRFERHPAWTEAVVGAYSDRLGLPAGLRPEEAVELARAADLLALLDLAVRRHENPVTRRGHDQLLAIATQRDLHAEAPAPG